MRGWIGVDLDGTLAFYDEYRGAGHVGAPILPMVQRVRDWLIEGIEVRIVTARVASNQTPEDIETARKAITKWCHAFIGVELPITAEKDYNMAELWDDRCVQVETNTGRPITEGLRKPIR